MDYNYSIFKSSICKLDFNHNQEYIHLYLVLSGKAATIKKTERLTYHSGELFIQKPDMQPFEIEINNGSVICLTIHKDYFGKYYLRNPLNIESHFEIHHFIKGSFIRTIRSMYEKNYAYADFHVIKLINYLRIYFDTFENYLFRPTLNPLINDTIEYVNDHYKLPLKVSVIANELFTNESFLSRKFKEEMNMTFTEYLNNVRLYSLVEDLMLTGDEGEKWKEYGFPSYRTFLKRFKANFNMTPREFIIDTQKYRNQENVISDSVYFEVLNMTHYEKPQFPEVL